MNRSTAHILGMTLAGVLAFSAAPRDCKGAAIPSADIFGSGANTFTIDFVNIGNAGNADDVNNPYPNPGDGGTPFGGVAYEYRMGVTEVSQDWITKATNQGMTNVTAGAFTGNQPAANMTWYEAAAFVNFLNTSTGHQPAYDLRYSSDWFMVLWSSGQAWRVGGENLYRHKDAFYFLPSEDEWYKAAYHKNDGVTANYWDYATGSDAIPVAVASGTEAGTAVYNDESPASVDNNGGLSPYGTRGQNGNVFEWQESALSAPNDSSDESRTIRGGDWSSGYAFLFSSARISYGPAFTSEGVGFRVASVPEPSAAILMIGSGLMFLLKRRRSSTL
jgi:hypothetical protein